MNRAVTALYEPGSTFKLITLAAAFDQEVTQPNEIFDCENGAIYIAGHRIRDHKPFGLLSQFFDCLNELPAEFVQSLSGRSVRKQFCPPQQQAGV